MLHAWWEGREENIFLLFRQRLNAATARAWNDKGEASFDSFLDRNAKLEALLDTARGRVIHPPVDRLTVSTTPIPGNLAHGKPDPLEITIDLGKVQAVGRIEVYKAEANGSWEQYKVSISSDNKSFTAIGKTENGSVAKRTRSCSSAKAGRHVTRASALTVVRI